MIRPLRVLSIATLFPDAARPNFGLFVVGLTLTFLGFAYEMVMLWTG